MPLLAIILILCCAARAGAQDWRDAARHLGASARVLLVGTRPEDEDNALIAWLTLGRHVETAYLSVTRGEHGANVLGAEREAALAVVRTAELLAERQRDGAHQYFTRAYDFGPAVADSTVDRGWPHDSLLVDVVSVIRAFRPHVVITLVHASDDDATRRATARIVAEAFAAAGDSLRFPPRSTSRLPAWTVARLFTSVDSAPRTGRVASVDVGEFDRAAGRSYAEFGAEIRRLQRSQPSPVAPTLGPLLRHLQLDSTRVGDASTVFGNLDTTLARVRAGIPDESRAQLDTLLRLIGDASVAASESPDSLAVRLARVASRTSAVRLSLPCTDVEGVPACPGAAGDLAVALNTIRERATRAMMGAASLVVVGTVARNLVAAGDSVRTDVTIYNGGTQPVVVRRVAATAQHVLMPLARDTAVRLTSGDRAHWTGELRVTSPSYHWWQIHGLVTGTWMHDFGRTRFTPVVPQLIAGEDRVRTSTVEATLAVGGVEVPVIVAPLAERTTTTLRGDERHPLEGVPPLSLLFERTAEYEPAGVAVDRLFRVYVWSARSTVDTGAVVLTLPKGLVADSLVRRVALPPFGARNVFFRLHGTLSAGADTISAKVRSLHSVGPLAHQQSTMKDISGADFALGVITHEYPHIPEQQYVRFAQERLQVVDAHVPARLRVAYVKGNDEIHAALVQLRINAQAIDPSLISVVDLSAFSTILVGGETLASDAMATAAPSLGEFLRRGGTVVVMGDGDAAARAGFFPYPVAFDSVARHIIDPDAPLHAPQSRSPLLTWPNLLSAADFAGWSGERARAVPAGYDSRYTAVLTSADAGQPEGAVLLSARVGKGTFVYSALTVDAQLAAAQPGAARLLVNLMSAASVHAGQQP